jgi:hypothetical protein
MIFAIEEYLKNKKKQVCLNRDFFRCASAFLQASSSKIKKSFANSYATSQY